MPNPDFSTPLTAERKNDVDGGSGSSENAGIAPTHDSAGSYGSCSGTFSDAVVGDACSPQSAEALASELDIQTGANHWSRWGLGTGGALAAVVLFCGIIAAGGLGFHLIEGHKDEERVNATMAKLQLVKEALGHNETLFAVRGAADCSNKCSCVTLRAFVSVHSTPCLRSC